MKVEFSANSFGESNQKHALIVGTWDPVWLPDTVDFWREIAGLTRPGEVVAAVLWPPPATILRGAEAMPIVHSFRFKEAVLRSAGVTKIVSVALDRGDLDAGASPFLAQLSKTIGIDRIFLGGDQSLGPTDKGNDAAIELAGDLLGIKVNRLSSSRSIPDSFGVRNSFRNGNMKQVRAKTGAWPVYHSADLPAMRSFLNRKSYKVFVADSWEQCTRAEHTAEIELSLHDCTDNSDVFYAIIG